MLILLVVHGVVLSSCVSLEDTVTQAPPTNVRYASSDGTELAGYLALPGGDGPRPAVLMIHEWWGLNRDVTLLADALASEGFVVLAADAFRGQLATTVPAAIAQNSSTPGERIHADLEGALEFLKRDPRVDPRRIATLGFCFGGRQSLRLGIRAEGLAAVVTLYGSGLVTDPREMGNLKANGPVLAIFGGDDTSIPRREIDAFRAGLDALGVENTITVYPGVGHAFVKSSTYRDDGAAGRAWAQVVEFLERSLR